MCALVIGGCSEGPEAAQSDSPSGSGNLTADLLAQPVSDGMSTPIVGDPTISDGGPPVQVSDLGFNRGDSAAVVKIVEMSDFGCGFCRKFHEETFPTLREQFIETGMVEWKFIPYITGMFENSLAATEAGECVMEQGADAYEEIALRMWTEQSEWKSSSSAEPLLRGWADELGIDMAGFDACMADDRRLNRVASATTLAGQLGVRGTPTFVILGYPPLQGALPTDFFQEILTAVHTEESRRREEGENPGN